MCEGYAVDQLLIQLVDEIASSSYLSDLQKANICHTIAKADKSLTDGADEYLQLLTVVSSMTHLVT